MPWQVFMSFHKEALLRVHAGCCNGHEVGLLMGHYGPQSRALLDGRLVGEGVEGIRLVLQREFEGNRISRVQRLDGDPVLVEYEGDGREPTAVLRLEAREGHVLEIRIERDAETVRRLVARAT